MGDWIEHDGSPMPVPADTLVEVRFRDGTEDAGMQAGDWSSETTNHQLPNGPCFWKWEPCSNEARQHSCDIIAYRVLPPD